MEGISKGTIASLDASGHKARVLKAAGAVTCDLVIPQRLRGAAGGLAKGTKVVFAEFADGSGILLERADGEWDHSSLGG